MKKGLILLLKIVILLISIGTIAGLVRFPQTEGRATNLDLISIYTDPLIIYSYIGSIPFFVGLYQAFKLVGYVEKNKMYSKAAALAVRNIKYCAMAIPVLIVIALAFIVLNANGEDFAGPVALGIFTIFVSIIIAITASVLQKRIYKLI